MLISSHAQHFRGHLERAETRSPRFCLPAAIAAVGKHYWVRDQHLRFSKATTRGLQGLFCNVSCHHPRQGGGGSSDWQVSPCTSHLLFCTHAKVSLKTCRTADFYRHFVHLGRIQAYLVMYIYVHLSHPLVSFVAFSWFCSPPGSFSVSAN